MTRYRAFLIIFVVVSILSVGWLFLRRVEYGTAGFDCDIPNLYGLECLKAAQSQIAHDIRIEAVPILIVWCISAWLFIRERKKR